MSTREYRLNNKEKIRAYGRLYDRTEKGRARHKRWEKLHPEILKKWKKEWRDKNPEKVKLMKKESRLRNRHTSIFTGLKTRCRDLGIELSITPEWIKERFERGICELTGIAFDMQVPMSPNSPSIDRINPNGGYTTENCRMIIWALNRALSNYGQEYMFMVFEKAINNVRNTRT